MTYEALYSYFIEGLSYDLCPPSEEASGFADVDDAAAPVEEARDAMSCVRAMSCA